MLVPEWLFPNAIAEACRKTAQLKGQHSNRLEIRDPDDRYPELRRATSATCSGTVNLTPHIPNSPKDPFCGRCGSLLIEPR